MTGPSPSSSAPPPSGDASPSRDPSDPRLEALREHLLGDAWARIRELEARVADKEQFAKDIATVLPDSVALRGEDDTRLGQVLTPALEDAIQGSVKRNPQVLIDVIFPVLGPAIRKAIRHAVGGLTQTINQSVESTFTPRGLRWRLEAWRTGRSYGEVALGHSLVYRIEQVFLIHRETGLLLEHVESPELVTNDPDVVSSMLSAIQDFAKDSFGVEDDSTLEEFQVGDTHVWLEPGPKALLAAVIRGTPPASFRERMQETLETVHAEKATALGEFSGDPAPFATVAPVLEGCLLERAREKKKSILGAVILSLGAAAFVAWWILSSLAERGHTNRFEAYQKLLEDEPGLVVLSTGGEPGDYTLTGLRDPLARTSDDVRLDTDLGPTKVREQWSLVPLPEPAFIRERLTGALPATRDAWFLLHDGVLVVDEAADPTWLTEARRILPLLGGPSEVRRDPRSVAEAITARWAGTALGFERDSSRLNKGASTTDLAAGLARLDRAAGALGLRLDIEIRGSAQVGEADFPGLATDRAEACIRALGGEGTYRHLVLTAGERLLEAGPPRAHVMWSLPEVRTR